MRWFIGFTTSNRIYFLEVSAFFTWGKTIFASLEFPSCYAKLSTTTFYGNWIFFQVSVTRHTEKKDRLPATLCILGIFQNKILTNFLHGYANTIKSLYRNVHFTFLPPKGSMQCAIKFWAYFRFFGPNTKLLELFDLIFFLIAYKASQSHMIWFSSINFQKLKIRQFLP